MIKKVLKKDLWRKNWNVMMKWWNIDRIYFFFIISNQIELKTPATSQVEDNFKGFLTVATKNWIEQNWLEIFEEFDFFLSCSHFFVVVLLSFNFILCLTVFIFFYGTVQILAQICLAKHLCLHSIIRLWSSLNQL